MTDKSIIEKLGISKGKMVSSGLEEGANVVAIDECSILSVHQELDPLTGEYKPWGIIPNKHDCDLFAAAPEMLERDIVFLSILESLKERVRNREITDIVFLIDHIFNCFNFSPDKKATNKPWEQIKELIK